ncbi:MAG: hypothetical protein LBB78_05760 [Spirochaetaceae bacterium]|jgi:hypothetical protein|nr:hypothetical protein [Spirochaetaceae bacterium]
MTKKSLFFGAAARPIALAIALLLVLLALVGCSNPTDGDSSPSTQILGGDFVYPLGTVFTNDFNELLGLLEPATNPTNGVDYIAYSGGSASFVGEQLVIPAGKTVYFNNGSDIDLGYGLTLGTPIDPENIVVEEGATLVLVTGLITAPAHVSGRGKLLVRGTVEVYDSLEVGEEARDVADYIVEDNGQYRGRNTVIGTGHVVVKAGGALYLRASDILAPGNPAMANKFTPGQAWAAAGSGSLVIGNDAAGNGVNNLATDDYLSTAYTVRYLLTGVAPSANRWYQVYTEGGDTLPSTIPAWAAITTLDAITDADDHRLTINGILFAPNATLGLIEELTISSTITEPPLTRAATDFDDLWPWTGYYSGSLGTDKATLAKVKKLTLGDNGVFVSDSPDIDLPVDSEIILGKSAVFEANAGSVNTFDNLKTLYLGPAAKVAILSSDLTFGALETLVIKDSGSLTAGTNKVTFTTETGKKLAATLGKNVFYNVGVAPTAKVNMAFDDNASLLPNSVLTVNEGSTFTVAPGKTLTVEGAAGGQTAVIDFLPTLASDSGLTEPPIKIDGTVVFGEYTELNFPDGTGFSTPGNFSKVISYGQTGKIVLKEGAVVNLGTSLYVGAVADNANFTVNPNFATPALDKPNSCIELSTDKLTVKGDVQINRLAVIQSYTGLELAEGSEVSFESTLPITLRLLGAAAGGTKITGRGKIIAGSTEIVGGTAGWQVYGTDSIDIIATSATASSIAVYPSTGTTTSLKALGAGATITQKAVASNNLNIGMNTKIDLGTDIATASRRAGEIILKNSAAGSAADNGKITLVDITSSIVTGNTASSATAATLSPTVTVASGVNAYTSIGVAYLTSSGAVAISTVAPNATPANTAPAGFLATLKPTAANVTITGGDATNTADGTKDGKISSETATLADVSP